MDDDPPRPQGDAAGRLSAESLDPYSQAELEERIALLEREIDRVKAHHAKAADQRRHADALFGRAASPGESG